MSEADFQQAVLDGLAGHSVGLRGLNSSVGALTADLAAVKADLAAVKADLAAVKGDVAELKADMAAVKADVAELKTDMAAVKSDVAQLNVRVQRLERETFHHYTSTTKDLQQVKRDLEFFTLTFDTRLSALESWSVDVTHTLGELTASVGERLETHAHRLEALEAKP